VLYQGDGVFHRQLGTRANGEMCGVRGISNENGSAVVPLVTGHPVEIQPGRAAEVIRVALQFVTTEVLAKEIFAEGDGLRRVRAIQPVSLPGLFARLDDHCREVLAELVSMRS